MYKSLILPIQSQVQKTGMAMETSGFTFGEHAPLFKLDTTKYLKLIVVTSGSKRDSLTGKATLQLFPHFSELAECAGSRS